MDFENTIYLGISTNMVVFWNRFNLVLSNKMDLSTLPNKPIQANDLYQPPDEVQGEVNYIDKVGTGYGWILILIGIAIFSIVFYVYFV